MDIWYRGGRTNRIIRVYGYDGDMVQYRMLWLGRWRNLKMTKSALEAYRQITPEEGRNAQ